MQSKRIILRTSIGEYYRLIEQGTNHINSDDFSSKLAQQIFFTVTMISNNEVRLQTYDYFPIVIKSQSYQIESLQYPNIIINFNDLPSLILQPDLTWFKSFYFYFQDLSLQNEDNSKGQGNIIKIKLPPSFTVNKPPQNETCSICLDAIVNKATLNSCDHFFCKKCIVTWSTSSSECPVCKKTYSRINSNDNTTTKVRRKEFKYKDQDAIYDAEDAWLATLAKTCLICDKNDNNYLMLVCDQCQHNISHTYCAGLDQIPKEEWYCSKCLSKENTSISNLNN